METLAGGTNALVKSPYLGIFSPQTTLERGKKPAQDTGITCSKLTRTTPNRRSENCRHTWRLIFRPPARRI
ncbi:hypothetical protein TERTU_3443 [Teredinibacter turnerae T7901]|uniref:Uncharacterized protein n=1 Tax=Teredinibacter turnerae (strain ATCC 39867 / T7901) TaxID=377629 RepID=C5BQU3_TERTT|nr:hypothetical protein TERTU_3443 [Teredinibacter turnerae T7901]